MKKILAVITAMMLVPSTVLASSIRPGSRPQTYKPKAPNCLVLVDDGEYVEEKWKSCEVVIDETGVTLPIGKIFNVVQWTTEEKDFNIKQILNNFPTMSISQLHKRNKST